jgi:hypothetical protein
MLVISPEWLRRRLVASALTTKHFNLELHGIDLADAALRRDFARARLPDSPTCACRWRASWPRSTLP